MMKKYPTKNLSLHLLRTLAVCLVLALLFTAAPFAGFLAIDLPAMPFPRAHAANIVDSGTCGAQGETLIWTFDDAGLLTISGTGKMSDFRAYIQNDTLEFFTPWRSYVGEITDVVIEEGVTSIGQAAMCAMNVNSITIPVSVQEFHSLAFTFFTVKTLYYAGTITEWNRIIYNTPTGNKSRIYDGGTIVYSCFCLHSETEVRNKTEVSCTENGYTGDVYCISCGQMLEKGVLIVANGHIDNNLDEFCDVCGMSYILAEGTMAQLKWRLDIFGKLQISGKGNMFNYTMSNGAPWYSHVGKITDVVIENGVTSIGNRALANCYNLKTVSIADTVASIGVDAFMNCRRVEKIILPETVTTIGINAFYSCGSLTEIYIPESVTSIGDSAFYECMSLERLTIPSKVDKIGNFMFWECEKLSDLVFKAAIQSVGKYAFFDCKSLKKIELGDQLRSLAEYAFYHSGITELVDISKLTAIPQYAFDSCAGLTDITIPGNIKVISEFAFTDCDNLSSVTLDQNIETIYSNSFDRDSNALFKVYRNSAGHIFTEMSGVKCEIIGEASENRIIEAELVYSLLPDGTYAVSEILNPASATTLYLPSTYNGSAVTAIQDNVFESCGNLLFAILPEGLGRIGSYAFANCPLLQRVSIPASITEIGAYAFFDCEKLGNVDFGNTDFNDFSRYLENHRVSAFIGTAFCYDLLVMPSYHTMDRSYMGERPEADKRILDHYIDELLSEITQPNDTDESKALKVYQWLQSNVGHILSGLSPYRNCYGALFFRVASSDGFAEAFKLFMDRIGMDCQIIEGTFQATAWGDDTSSRTWNLLSKNGTWTHVDAAFGLFMVNDQVMVFSKGFQYSWDSQKYPHVYTRSVREATCTAGGYTTYRCTTCQDSYRANATSALGHDCVQHDARAFSCTEDGWEAYETCTRCSYTTYKAIPATGHLQTLTATHAKAATCIEEGNNAFWTCAVCTKVFKNANATAETTVVAETLAALGHNFGIWATTTASTCIAEGTKRRDCSRCDHFETSVIEKKDHTVVTDPAVAATCIAMGLSEGKHCSVCGEVLVAQESISAAHSGETYEAVIAAATCVAGGSMGTYCADCDVLLSTAALDKNPANHTGETYEAVITAATFDEVGTMGIYCDDCDALLTTTEIPKLSDITPVIPDGMAAKMVGDDILLSATFLSGEELRAVFGDRVAFTLSATGGAYTGMTVTLSDADGSIVDSVTVVVLGDTDGDGRITAEDARFALRSAVELETPNELQFMAADANGDGKLTADDARSILRAAVGLETLQ